MPNNFEIVFDANTFIPASTGYADRGVAQDRLIANFGPGDTDVMITPAVRLPSSYTGSGTLKAEIAYFSAATTGGVRWEIEVEAISDGDALDLAAASGFDTANPLSVTVPATANQLDVATVTLTNKDGAAAGDSVRFKLTRDHDHVDDTAASNASVLSLTIYEETA